MNMPCPDPHGIEIGLRSLEWAEYWTGLLFIPLKLFLFFSLSVVAVCVRSSREPSTEHLDIIFLTFTKYDIQATNLYLGQVSILVPSG